jgi:transcriptional regulator with GAF, ATPase, and Fis domain
MNLSTTRSYPLSDEDYSLLPIAALFEGDFSIDWIVELTGRKASQVLRALEEGCQQGWCARKNSGVFLISDPQRKQIFLELLPETKQKSLRRSIVDLMQRDLPDEAEKAISIAYHLLRMENTVEYARWLVKAGDLHRQSFRTEEALHCYEKVLTDLSPLSGEELDHLFIETAIRYSKISTARHPAQEVIAILQDALGRAEKWGNMASQSLLEMHLAKNEWLRSQYPSALRHFESGWSLAREVEDPKVLRSISTFSTFFLYWQGRFQEAVRTYEKNVSDVDKFPRGRFPLLAGAMLGQCYAYLGQVTQGLGMLDAIRNHCLERGDLFLTANVEATMGIILLDIRRTDEAIQYLKNAVEKASREHNYVIQIFGNLSLAHAYYLLCEPRRSIPYLKAFLEKTQQVNMTVQLYPSLFELCWAMEQGSLPQLAGLDLREEIRRSIDSQNVFMKGIAYRYQALLLRQEGFPPDQIFHSLQLSRKWLEESGNQIELAQTDLEIARQHLLGGEEYKAREIIRAACSILSSHHESLIPDDLKPLASDPPPSEKLLNEILKLGQEVVTIRDNKDLVQHILSTGNKITGAERGAILLFEGTNRPSRLKLRASKNLTSDQVTQPEFSSSWKMIEEAASSGKGLIQGPERKNGTSPGREVIRSRICVPMILRNKVVGVLYHDNRLLSSAFKESALELMAYFGALAAFALDNAAAYEEIQKLNQKLNEEKKYYEEQQRQSIHFESIIGESLAIRRVLDQVAQVASTESTVVIRGETGVGKELVARATHNHSLRRSKPFIRVHCSSLPESLIPSELFGHEKGAFTGAGHRRIGRFELADGGTLFLDEIGDLPLEIQVHLLRVLQSREFERVGGSETLRSDFRLIVATNRNLEQLIQEGKFRDDLYYRINVFPIYMPSLRERIEDIPLLAYYFLKNYSRKMGKNFEKIPEGEMEKMLQYDWPGNVRELENIIERGTILSTPPDFQVPGLHTRHPDLAAPANGVTLRDNERRYILWALQKTRWKVRGPGGSAELLDIHPSTLEFRIKKLGIQRPPKGSFKNRTAH